MKKLNYHQRQGQGKVFYPNCPRTNTTNRKKYYGLLIAGFFVFMMVFGTSTYGVNMDRDGTGVIEPTKDNMVNTSGAYTTSIPIALPAARGNIDLSLALSYNSNGGNGKLGVGWGLSGIPTIVRTGIRKGTPKYDGTDEFYFNGQKLIYDSANSVWHTERQSYLRIKSINSPYTGTTSRWEITDKNGTKMYLGENSTTSHQGRIKAVDGPGEDRPRLWSLYKMEDVDGNILLVTYGDGTGNGNGQDNTNGDYYVEKIEYDGGGKVIFNWQSRTDKILSYRSASKVEIDRKLDWVQTYRRTPQGTDYRINEYDLSYITSQLDSARALLSSVRLYGEDNGASYPTTEFTYYGKTEGWDTDNSNWHVNEEFGSNSYNYHVRIADLNGDGLQDVIRADENVEDIVWLNTKSGWTCTGTGDWESEIEFGRSNAGRDYNVRILDFNGDGMSDMIQSDEYDGEDVRLNDGSGWTTTSSSWNPPEYFGNRYYGRDYFVRIADLNGDGLPDMIRADESDDPVVHLNTGSGWTCTGTGDWESEIDFGKSSTYTDYKVRIVDLNGDGLPDMIQSSASADNVYFNNGNGWTGAPSSWYAPEIFDDTVKIADINGDGLPDIIKADEAGSDDVYYNTGSGWIEEPYTIWDPPINFGNSDTGKDFNVRMVDINGDGLVDIVQADHDEGDNVRLNKSKPWTDKLEEINNPIGGTTRIVYIVNKEANDTKRICNPVVVGTIYQEDGLGGSFYTEYGFYDSYFDQSEREFRGFAIVKEKDPKANWTETHYHQGTGASGDEEWKKGLIKKSMTRSTSNGSIYDYVYNTYVDHCAGSSHFTHYGYGISGVHAPLLTQVDTYVVDGSTSTDNGSSPGGTYKHIRTEISYDDPDSSTAKEYGDPYEIENLGDLSNSYGKTKTLFSYAVDPGYWVIKPCEKEVFGTNSQSSGYPTEPQVREEYYYDGTLTSATSWLDHGSVDTGHLKCARAYKDDSNFIYAKRLAYDEDGYGNVTKVLDANGKETTIVYDSKYHLFPVKTTLPTISGGTFSSYNYYDSYSYTGDTINTISNNITRGRPVMAKDINDQIVKTYYDNLGRVTDVRKPGDHTGDPTIQYDYHFYTSSSDPAYVKTELKDGNTVGLESYTYIDGLGRTVQTKKEALEGDSSTTKWATVNTWSYFDLSNKHSVTETRAPYFSTTSSFNRPTSPSGGRTKTESYYGGSDYGKVAKLTAPDGTISYTYSKRLVTTTRNAMNYGGKLTVDGLGNVIETKVYDEVYDTNNYCYPSGSLYRTDKFYCNTGTGQLVKKVEDSGTGKNNVTTTMAYDMLGRNTSTTDEDSGTWNYYYDSYGGYASYGNLIAQKDAENQTVSMTYDALNRVTYKETSEYDNNKRIANYTYDSGTNGKGRLTRVNDGSMCYTAYTYDARGRTIKEEKMIDNDTFVTDWTYDSMDRVDTITYPHDGSTREVVRYAYGADGNLDELGTTSDADQYIDDIYYDAFGRMTRLEYQNGTNNAYTTYEYYSSSDNYRLENIYAGEGDSSPATMMDYTYSYDNVGNITNINAANNNYDQDFTYDFANRLTAQTNSGYPFGSKNYSYNKLNHITYKSDIGNFSYGSGSAGPHAVTSAGGKSYTYDGNGNMITAGSNTFSFDATNHLVKSVVGGTTDEYDYDHAGNRRMKGILYKVGDVNGDGGVTTSDVMRIYNRNLSGSPSLKTGTFYVSPLYEEEWTDRRKSNEQCAHRIKYYYANGQKIAKKDNSTLSFYHTDHLGGSARITDSNGTERHKIVYLPYGNGISSGSSDYEPFYKFTGKELDDSGLYYYGARYYDRYLGRFISPDNYGDNYIYCLNNPVNYVDPTGNYVESLLDIGFIGYDLNQLYNDPSLLNVAALGADVACLALPVATGGGAGVRGLGKLLGRSGKAAGKADDPGKITKSFKWLEDNYTKGPTKRRVTNYVMEKGAKSNDAFRDARGVLNKKHRAHYNKGHKSGAEFYSEMAASTFETALWGAAASAAAQYANAGFDVSGISLKKVGFDTLTYGVFGGLLGGAKPFTDKMGKKQASIATNLLFIPTAAMQGAYREQSAGETAANYGVMRPFVYAKNVRWNYGDPLFQPSQVVLRFAAMGVMEFNPFSSD